MFNSDSDLSKTTLLPQSNDQIEVVLPFLSKKIFKESSLRQISPISLAYLGDVVYELYIREYYLFPLKRINDYHQKVVEKVKAESQALYLEYLQSYLTEEEKEIVRRGRNAVKKSPRRLSLKIYQQATALETLLGYLYLHDGERLAYLLNLLQNIE